MAHTLICCRNDCWAELQVAATTGTINPKGKLHAGLRMTVELLKPHSVLMESINSLLKRVAQDCPNISLELLSARVCLKKTLGFTMESMQAVKEFVLLKRSSRKSFVTEQTESQSERPKGIKAFSPQTLVSSLSVKRARPFALTLSSKLVPFMSEAGRVVQTMERWTCPVALHGLANVNCRLMNYDDRPYVALSKEEQRVIRIAQQYHKQWFNDYSNQYSGHLTLIAFCAPWPSARMRCKTSPLEMIEEAFIIGEIHYRQAGEHVTSMHCNYIIVIATR